jgi:isoleucyl-tRNA synthetase
MFKPTTAKVDFPAMERETLEWWRETGMVRKYLHRNDAAERRFSFIDGPITANNPMGVHHAWGRTYKDMFQRYKTMRGFKQRYQNGFDGQGLWIEVEVEKELGFQSKRDIEAYGIDRFVELCKERVRKFAEVLTQQSVRLGYWMDWDNSYHTMSDENNYTIWHFLKVCHERGWLYEGTDVMPWCPRCGTGISEHEIVTEGYREVVHPGLFVRLPLTDRQGESLLVWTTTPWTLSSNVAAAVNPKLTYVRVRQGDEILYLAKERLSVLQGDHEAVGELPGGDLVGLRYQGPFDELPAQAGVEHRVVPWSDVSQDEGTGIVHIAPGAGREDFALGKEHGLPAIAPLDESGAFVEGFDWLTGMAVSEVNQPIFDSLRGKGVLYHVEDYPHRYPVCWRCETQLVFRLVNEWFISMDELRHLIADVTRKVQWIPEFGLKRELDWLNNMDDWMISKKRYWGLALPIYKCDCGHFDVIGSHQELRERAAEGWDAFDGRSPHRPWIDSVKIRCPDCGQTVSRIKDVGNPWLDAGIVPFSTTGYLSDPGHWEQWFPADWISESFPGQFRNWFYSLLTMSTVLENREPTASIFSYALMRDEHGQEMHKSRGTAIWFDEAAEEMGADTMRWLFTLHNPVLNLNFGPSIANDARRRFLIPLWNTYNFFVTYANLDGFDPMDPPATPPTADLDRWILSELQTLVRGVTDALEGYDPADAGRRMEDFGDVLSTWYVRRSRRRFWKSENDADKRSAYHTLYACLVTLSKLLAPFTPFMAEAIYQNLVRSVDPDGPESVHLADYPEADPALMDPDLVQATRLVMRVVGLGRAARGKAGVKVRQPLSALVVMPRHPAEAAPLGRLLGQVREELNVKDVQVLDAAGAVSHLALRLNTSVLGPKHQGRLPELRRAFEAAPREALLPRVLAGQPLEIDGFTLEPGEVEVAPVEAEGLAGVLEGGYYAAVVTTITPELAQEGLARELVHRVQNMRRSAGLDISDRISITYQGDAAVGAVLADGPLSEYVRGETLAVRLTEGPPEEGAYSETLKMDGSQVTLGVVKQ